MFFLRKACLKKQNKTRLKTKFQYWYFVVFIHVVLRTDSSRGHKTDFHSFANAHAKLQKK